MKPSHCFLFFLFLIGTLFISCKKDGQVARPGQVAPKFYARTLKVYDATSQNSATLRFQSSSEETLAAMALDRFEFILAKPSRPAANNSGKLTASSPFGTVNLSENYSDENLSAVDELQESGKVIYVDILPANGSETVAIEVRHKAPVISSNRTTGLSSVETLYPPGVQLLFHGAGHWRRIQIDNLSSNALNVAFYYNSCDGNTCQTNGDLKGTFTRYSGYSFNLYLNGWAWYYNCNRGVGALITIAPNTGYHYRWTAWSNCTP